MMKQYMEIKNKYSDCLVFYRMGDFYELFLEDAHVGAKILNITLTGKSNGKNERIPMAGIPYHALDTYLSKLVKAGYKVAICEQLSEPNKKGLVERDVVRIVTPGTIMDEKALEKKENNYIVSLTLFHDSFAYAACDISTGEFITTQQETKTVFQQIQDELARLSPAECILSDSLYNNAAFLRTLKTQNGMNIYCFSQWEHLSHNAESILKTHFGVATLEGFGIADQPLAIEASGVLLSYLHDTQKGNIQHIKKIQTPDNQKNLILDRSTILNLELFSTIREHSTKGTLIDVLDETSTAMGGRVLRQWVRKPLRDKEEIEKRLDAVEELLLDREKRIILMELLTSICDIERLISRLSTGLGTARDLIQLSGTLQTVLDLRTHLQSFSSPILHDVYKAINPQIEEIKNRIDACVLAEPAWNVKEGGIIKDHVSKELDHLRNLVRGGKEWIKEMEQKERIRTGINSLKVRYNKVFGFYIEISNSNLHLVPSDYLRKQTLVGGERFSTPELKKQEEIILTAQEHINEIEYEIFLHLVTTTLGSIEILQNASRCIAVFDCLITFATLSESRHYMKPSLSLSGDVKIIGGRHPVVEKLLDTRAFVPNTVTFDTHQQVLLITGPNMAGKSVLIRQVALIVLMSHIGCFVPADEAHIRIVDRIFVRSGASDVITSGLSTFMVEMVETAHILNNATSDSLIIMDEIGRGTSTYDGISIAWAIAQYLATHFKESPHTLFATHYHELQALEDQYPDVIKNFHMAVADHHGNPAFLYTLASGGASHSFGVAVAKLAGIPEEVIGKANEMLNVLEERNDSSREPKSIETYSLHISEHLFTKEVLDIDIHTMTPLDALNTLSNLKEKVKFLHGQTRTARTAD